MTSKYWTLCMCALTSLSNTTVNCRKSHPNVQRTPNMQKRLHCHFHPIIPNSTVQPVQIFTRLITVTNQRQDPYVQFYYISFLTISLLVLRICIRLFSRWLLMHSVSRKTVEVIHREAHQSPGQETYFVKVPDPLSSVQVELKISHDVPLHSHVNTRHSLSPATLLLLLAGHLSVPVHR